MCYIEILNFEFKYSLEFEFEIRKIVCRTQNIPEMEDFFNDKNSDD